MANTLPPLRPRLRSRVVFEVQVPDDTPGDAGVFICGNRPEIGSWSARGLRLERRHPGLYRGGVDFKGLGGEVEWKITRGRWDLVEKKKGGRDRENRKDSLHDGAIIRARVTAWGEPDGPPPENQPALASERVTLLGSFGADTTGEDRPVWVHLPPDFDETRDYPLLYMLDGQNVFDPATAFAGQTWAADHVSARLMEARKVQPFIICAIAHKTDRSFEYTPVRDYFFEGGGLHTLADLIHEEVGPALREQFRVRSDARFTGVMGSSLGGLASFHLAWRHPERFGLAGVVSPSLWWAGRYTLKMVSQDFKKRSAKTRYWIDMGGREGKQPKVLLNSVRQLHQLLKSRGIDAKLYIDDEAEHNEPSWRRRLHLPFQYLFPPED